jgi:hypothetical protein
LLSTVAAALIVVSGALYALFFALGRLYESARLGRIAWVAYGALVIWTLLLADTLKLGGGWLLIIVVVLIGYLLAPMAIWHLSRATHPGAREHRPQRNVSRES